MIANPGSSPHTRGAPYWLRVHKLLTWDHPRIRGEHGTVRPDASPSPGIIPAYAGSTLSSTMTSNYSAGSSPHTRGARQPWSCRPAWFRDHPRIRGEHAGARRLPPMPRRIIPAYAGSTHASMHGGEGNSGSSPHTRGAPARAPREACARRDHPRIRGEHNMVAGYKDERGGSSPHTRGAPRYRSPRTPAWGDHPRIRGEHACSFAVSVDSTGSSPHTRGAHLTTCVTILHSPALDSLVRVQWCISTRPPPRTYPPNFLAARYLLALLQPF